MTVREVSAAEKTIGGKVYNKLRAFREMRVSI